MSLIDVIGVNEFPLETGFEMFKAFKGNNRSISRQFYDAMIRAASGKKMESKLDVTKGIIGYLAKFGPDVFVGWKYNDGSAYCSFPTGNGDDSVMLVDLVAGTFFTTQFPDADFHEPGGGAVLVSIVVPAYEPPAAMVPQEEARQPKQKRAKKDNNAAAAAAAAAATEAGEVVEVK